MQLAHLVLKNLVDFVSTSCLCGKKQYKASSISLTYFYTFKKGNFVTFALSDLSRTLMKISVSGLLKVVCT